jgi:hypothetical protein
MKKKLILTFYLLGLSMAAFAQGLSQPQIQLPDAKDRKIDQRPAEVSPELASAKDNVPVKKETFAAKLARIKADGNKIGVAFTCKPLRANPGIGGGNAGSSTFGELLEVKGEIDEPSFLTLGNDLVQELNEALGTTDIELIDLTKIPVKEVSLLGQKGWIDNYWATKYKIVFVYDVDPQIRAMKDSFGDCNYNIYFFSHVVVTEFAGGPGSKDQDIITQSPSLGYFTTPNYSQKEVLPDLEAIYAKVKEKVGAQLADKIKERRSSDVKKFAEKKLK